MRALSKRTAMLSLAATAALAAILVLILSGGHRQPHRRHPGSNGAAPSDVQIAAGYLGMSPAELRRRLRTGETLGQVADTGTGTSKQGLLDALLRARTEAVRRRGLSTAAERERLTSISRKLKSELRRTRHGASRELALASGYLGLREGVLTSRLASGMSLAGIAESTAGKSRSGLIAALTRTREGRLREAVARHELTNASAQAAAHTFDARTVREVDHKGPLGTG